MRIILAATPLAGHVNPILAASRILVAAGHEVIIVTGSAFRHRAEACDARFVPLGSGADIDMGDLDAAFPERKFVAPGPAQLRFDFEHMFIDTIPGQFHTLDALLADFPADVIMADTAFSGALPYLLGARSVRPLIVGLGVTFLTFHRDDGAPMGLGLPPAQCEQQRAQYTAIAEQVETGFLGPVTQRANAVLASLGASPLPGGYGDAMVALPDLYLQPAVAQFEYTRRDMPAGVRFIGAMPPLPAPDIPPRIAAAIREGKRLVLITQGTVANKDFGQLLAPAMAALAQRDDLLVLATTGGRALAAIPGDVPGNAMVATFLPFDAIMPHVEVLVTNGGYGTVTHALSQGAAIVAGGLGEDKPEVNARIAWSGAGIDLMTDYPSVAQLREALFAVLDGESHRSHARALAAQFALHDARSEMLAHLESAVAARH